MDGKRFKAALVERDRLEGTIVPSISKFKIMQRRTHFGWLSAGMRIMVEALCTRKLFKEQLSDAVTVIMMLLL
jgi:hypothetical protein